jgi:hypothetical protein
MIELQPEEVVLRDTIQQKLHQSDQRYAQAVGFEESRNLLLEAGAAAHRLHMLLKGRGQEPKHHAYMIRNRGLQPHDPEFYMQVHAIQDLLAFLINPSANDDPVDDTIGAEFEFIVYSRRWSRDDTYRITRTEDGWDVRHMAIGGPCDAGGHPFLYQNFDQDFISYPSKLDLRLEWLWEQAKAQGLGYNDVQHALQLLADWVSETEKAAPTDGVWEGY